ncbi:GntR family transcriptional regulator [Bacillus salitolerans]|uniref:GntR family transcriptional regulator n=1 Tax=Bacillus salitolerans TaxID=1437434 RepID=A0ABW4LS17_9BACI
MLDKRSPVPIYYQLEELIKSSIEEGKLLPGDSIPSEREYAELYDVSRMTVRQAITNLVHQGYLYRIKGKGTFIQNQKIEQRLQGLTSFSEEMKSRGFSPSTELLQFQIKKADELILHELQLEGPQEIYHLKRLRLADFVPMALETVCLPTLLLPNVTENIARGSLYSYVEDELHLQIDYATQEIEATVANAEESELLKIPKGSPTLTIKRICYLENGVAFESAKTVFRGDRYKFTVDVKRI